MPSEKKLRNDQVKDIVEAEGLGYAIQWYLSSDRIGDEKLAKQWKIAADAMYEIAEILDLDC